VTRYYTVMHATRQILSFRLLVRQLAALERELQLPSSIHQHIALLCPQTRQMKPILASVLLVILLAGSLLSVEASKASGCSDNTLFRDH
jgi:hypothetical protein